MINHILANISLIATVKKSHILEVLTDSMSVRGRNRGHLEHHDSPWPTSEDFKAYHLYLTADEEIKEGDWVVWTDNFAGWEKIGKALDTGAYKGRLKIDNGGSGFQVTKYRKIVATTNEELWTKTITGEEYLGGGHYAKTFKTRFGIPHIPQTLIEHYIKKYNESNPIKQVWLEQRRTEMVVNAARDGNYEGRCPICKSYAHFIGTGGITCDNLHELKLRSDDSVIWKLDKKEKLYTREQVKDMAQNIRLWTDGKFSNIEFNEWFDRVCPE